MHNETALLAIIIALVTANLLLASEITINTIKSKEDVIKLLSSQESVDNVF